MQKYLIYLIESRENTITVQECVEWVQMLIFDHTKAQGYISIFVKALTTRMKYWNYPNFIENSIVTDTPFQNNGSFYNVKSKSVHQKLRGKMVKILLQLVPSA